MSRTLNRLSNLQRLSKRPEFLAVARSGRRWATPGLVLQMRRREAVARQAEPEDQAEETEAGAIRVGFTASKKVGNAVCRNRAKRRLRALASEILASEGKAGHDYVLIGRHATIKRPYPALQQDLATALLKVHQAKARQNNRRAGSSNRNQGPKKA